jgi:mannose-6-phosphate isomerase-like protein (cupin superfamily)
MAVVGQEMVNPISRERWVWLHTAASTGGAFCEFELHLGQGALVAASHIHPFQQERFEVKTGAIRVKAGGVEALLGPGDSRTVEAGAVHAWSNAAEGSSVVLVRLTPALRSEDFFAGFCALAHSGKANSKGMPRNPLRLAVYAHQFRREAQLPATANPIVATILRAFAALGRAVGIETPERGAENAPG